MVVPCLRPDCLGFHVAVPKGLEARAREGKITSGTRGRKAATVRETGFSAATRLLIRTRAGNGDPDEARCEACAVWLGRYGGECQHIQARGSGGSRLRNRVSNGALLCGTALDPRTCHGKCEARSARMRAMGFWLKQSDPRGPVMLHGDQGGACVWLTDDGFYSMDNPLLVSA